MKSKQLENKCPALELLNRQYKGSIESNVNIIMRPVNGVKATVNASMVCGECTEEGGGSSGQCR